MGVLDGSRLDADRWPAITFEEGGSTICSVTGQGWDQVTEQA